MSPQTMTLVEFHAWYGATVGPWMVALTVVGFALLIVGLRYHDRPVPVRGRVLIATCAALALAGAGVAASDGIAYYDICLSLEPFTAKWWLLGCWWPY